MSLARRHHNIFFYYRGPSAKALNQGDAHRQLEDNATKALVNMLEHGSPGLARSFAGRFAPGLEHGWGDAERAAFYLQGGPAGGPTELGTGPRFLLGISIDGAVDEKAVEAPPDAGTRIDASIVPPHGGFIAVETKVVELLDPHQLERHRVFWKIADENVRHRRWVEIWEWAREQRASEPEPVSRFLLAQFCEYLEILGFGRWAGFREEDFAQFVDWSWQHQPVLRARMRAAWERVLELMPPTDAAWLGAIESGRLGMRDTHAWAQTNRGQPGANLDLLLAPDGVQMNLTGWRAAQAQRLAHWLDAHPAQAPDLELVVHERHAGRDKHDAPEWNHTKDVEITRLSPAEVRAGAFTAWRQEWEATHDARWVKLAYHLRHSWSRDCVLEEGEDLAHEIGQLASQAIPLLRAINRWKQPLGPAEP